VLVELDLSRGNIFYFFVLGWLYALVGSVFNFSESNLCAELSFLEILLSCLWLLTSAILVLYLLYRFVPNNKLIQKENNIQMSRRALKI
jgi:uncharacterized BrkB/YihY/UPF0761 family membrane protein